MTASNGSAHQLQRGRDREAPVVPAVLA
jgi:hypothetical protein